MADRQGYENNDFTGGITDEFVPHKDNRLDAACNLCLDYDLTPIQRPGTGMLTGANSSFGKNAEQTTTVAGLISSDIALNAFTYAKAFKYENGPAFVRLNVEQDRNAPTSNFHAPQYFANIMTPALVPITTGTINGFSSKNIIYAQSSASSFAQKYFHSEQTGLGLDLTQDYSIPVGLPKMNDFHKPGRVSASTPINYVDVYGNSEFVLTQQAGSGPFAVKYNVVTNTAPHEYDISDIPGKTYAVLNNGVKQDIKTYTNSYLISFVYKIKYKTNGVVYEKRSAPSTPFYFLCDDNLATGGTSTTPYALRCKLDLKRYRSLMEQMHTPLFPQIDPAGDPSYLRGQYEYGQVRFELEAYMSDANGSVLKRVNFAEDTLYLAQFSPINPNIALDEEYIKFNGVIPGYTIQDYVHVYLSLKETLDADRVPLYTTGGVLPYTPPPPCKYIANVGGYTYYGNIKELEDNNHVVMLNDSTSFLDVPYRIKQSNVLDPDSVPEGNYIDFPDEVTGIGSILDRCIVATTNAIYRVDGRYDDFGAGLVGAQILTTEVGCISHKSMVSVKDKLFFCGDDGIYVTDGVYVSSVSSHISRTYKQLVSTITTDSAGDVLNVNATTQDTISAVYDRTYDRVLFSFGNKILALELKASTLENGEGCFYGPWTTGGDEVNAPTSFAAVAVYLNRIIRGDSLGYVYQFSAGYLADPNSSALVTPSNWGVQPIIYRLRTAKFNFGSLVIKKWVSILTMILKRRKVLRGGVTDIDVAIHSYNDGERTRQYLKPVHYTGAKDCVYDQDPKTGTISVPKDITNTLVNEQRRFGAGGLRCLTKAVEFTNGYHLVYKSDDYESAAISGVYASLPHMLWPAPLVSVTSKGYFICFDNDNYASKYSILSATTSTLTLSSAPVAGFHKWKIYAYSTAQFFGLHSIGMVYTSFGSKHETYTYDSQGGNVGDTGE